MENPYEDRIVPLTSLMSGYGCDIAERVYGLCVQIVNVCFIERADDDGWVLVDAGLPRHVADIETAAKTRFDLFGRPKAIILTHGHFDHVGSVIELVEDWKVPVYAHKLELPFLTGRENYPSGNPDVGGFVSRMSPTFPNHSIQLNNHVHALPDSGEVPFLPDWKWVHTPGHTPGHISLFRPSDGTLIAGDAVTTVEQASLYDVFTQKEELHGPPPYFTMDWDAAAKSVKAIAELYPHRLFSGHGPLLQDTTEISLQERLRAFANTFEGTEVPPEFRERKPDTFH